MEENKTREKSIQTLRIISISLLFITITLAITYAVLLQTTETKTDVIATISETKYEEAGYKTVPRYNPTTGTTSYTRVHYSEKYLVTITYDEISITLDNKVLYEQVKQGDDICMVLYQTFYKNGNLASQKLEFPE